MKNHTNSEQDIESITNENYYSSFSFSTIRTNIKDFFSKKDFTLIPSFDYKTSSQKNYSPLKMALKALEQKNSILNIGWDVRGSQSGLVNVSWTTPNWSRGFSISKSGISLNTTSYSEFRSRVVEAREILNNYSPGGIEYLFSSDHNFNPNSIENLQKRLIAKDKRREQLKYQRNIYS